MLRDITIGQHFPGNSALHTMDPRLKMCIRDSPETGRGAQA